VKTVVERYTANILRDARAAKRDRRETCSLSMIVDEDEYGAGRAERNDRLA